VLNKVTPED